MNLESRNLCFALTFVFAVAWLGSLAIIAVRSCR
jgi:hypothetical protein